MTIYFNSIVGLHHVSVEYLKATSWSAELFLMEDMKTNFGMASAWSPA